MPISVCPSELPFHLSLFVDMSEEEIENVTQPPRMVLSKSLKTYFSSFDLPLFD
jgi:hypothetical protein